MKCCDHAVLGYMAGEGLSGLTLFLVGIARGSDGLLCAGLTLLFHAAGSLVYVLARVFLRGVVLIRGLFLAIALCAAAAHAEDIVDGLTSSCRPVGPKVYLLASMCEKDQPSRVVEVPGAIHPGECLRVKVVSGPNMGRSRCKAKLRKGSR